MIYLEVETSHYTFRAFGETEAQARLALKLAWTAHCAQTGAEEDYLDPATDGNVFEVQAGECWRDDALMIANGIPVQPDGRPSYGDWAGKD